MTTSQYPNRTMHGGCNDPRPRGRGVGVYASAAVETSAPVAANPHLGPRLGRRGRRPKGLSSRDVLDVATRREGGSAGLCGSTVKWSAAEKESEGVAVAVTVRGQQTRPSEGSLTGRRGRDARPSPRRLIAASSRTASPPRTSSTSTSSHSCREARRTATASATTAFRRTGQEDAYIGLRGVLLGAT